MQAYSPEMRRDVLSVSAAGATTHEIAIELKLSKSWVRRVKQEFCEQRFREQRKTAPQATRTRTASWQQHADGIRQKVEGQPDIDLHELQTAAQQELGWTASDMTFVRALRALRLTRKKDIDCR